MSHAYCPSAWDSVYLSEYFKIPDCCKHQQHSLRWHYELLMRSLVINHHNLIWYDLDIIIQTTTTVIFWYWCLKNLRSKICRYMQCSICIFALKTLRRNGLSSSDSIILKLLCHNYNLLYYQNVPNSSLVLFPDIILSSRPTFVWYARI